MSAMTRSGPGPRRWTRLLARWETLLLVALLGLIVVGNSLSPFFLTPGNFSNLVSALMEVAIMALPLTLLIILGEIDLSVESMAGLASAALGFMWAAGVPLEIGIPIVLVIGAMGGLLNGTLVALGGLPSLVVTLGTLALFRGMALIILGPRGVSDFPPWFTELGFGDVPGHGDPVVVRGLPRDRVGPGHRAPPDVDRPPDLSRSAGTPARRASPGSGSPASASACSSCRGPSRPWPA